MGAKQAVMRAMREIIRFNTDVAKAVAAMRQRGLPRREAQKSWVCFSDCALITAPNRTASAER